MLSLCAINERRNIVIFCDNRMNVKLCVFFVFEISYSSNFEPIISTRNVISTRIHFKFAADNDKTRTVISLLIQCQSE